MIIAIGGIMESIDSLKARADQGDRDAQYELARRYEDGIGVLRDYIQAAKYYELAAEQGDSKAKYDLAFRYKFGIGDVRDHVKASYYQELAEEQELDEIRDKLGLPKNTRVTMDREPTYSTMRWFND